MSALLNSKILEICPIVYVQSSHLRALSKMRGDVKRGVKLLLALCSVYLLLILSSSVKNPLECPKRVETVINRNKSCSWGGKDIIGRVPAPNFSRNYTWTDLNRKHGSDMKEGGLFRPEECKAQQKVAIIIPFRDREQHLKVFLDNMLPILKRQLLEFQVFVIEQLPGEEFSRGTLLNVGYDVAVKHGNFSCLVFHDVDHILEDDRLFYHCDGKNPRHMAVELDKWKYRLFYAKFAGGILSIPRKSYEMLNGYSNLFWGWGGEDDDFWRRIDIHPNFTLIRPEPGFGRYRTAPHNHSKTDIEEERYKLLRHTRSRWHRDGINSLKYSLVYTDHNPLYTHAFVEIHRKDFPRVDKERAILVEKAAANATFREYLVRQGHKWYNTESDAYRKAAGLPLIVRKKKKNNFIKPDEKRKKLNTDKKETEKDKTKKKDSDKDGKTKPEPKHNKTAQNEKLTTVNVKTTPSAKKNGKNETKPADKPKLTKI